MFTNLKNMICSFLGLRVKKVEETVESVVSETVAVTEKIADKAFEATYVTSFSQPPTPPVVVNTVEAKINNNLILAKPQEVQRAIKESGKSKKEELEEELDMELELVELEIEELELLELELVDELLELELVDIEIIKAVGTG